MQNLPIDYRGRTQPRPTHGGQRVCPTQEAEAPAARKAPRRLRLGRTDLGGLERSTTASRHADIDCLTPIIGHYSETPRLATVALSSRKPTSTVENTSAARDRSVAEDDCVRDVDSVMDDDSAAENDLARDQSQAGKLREAAMLAKSVPEDWHATMLEKGRNSGQFWQSSQIEIPLAQMSSIQRSVHLFSMVTLHDQVSAVRSRLMHLAFFMTVRQACAARGETITWQFIRHPAADTRGSTYRGVKSYLDAVVNEILDSTSTSKSRKDLQAQLHSEFKKGRLLSALPLGACCALHDVNITKLKTLGAPVLREGFDHVKDEWESLYGDMEMRLLEAIVPTASKRKRIDDDQGTALKH